MELQKTIYNYIPKSESIVELLRTLGVSEDIIYNNKRGNFWRRNEGNLEYLLYDFKKHYLLKIKDLHPDKENGDLERATIINSTWKEIQRRFENRLNPRLNIRTSNIICVTRVKPAKLKIKIKKNCLCGCNREFETFRKNRKYFSTKCCWRIATSNYIKRKNLVKV